MKGELFAKEAIDFAAAVIHIADNGVADVFEVSADLMESTGLGERLDERKGADGEFCGGQAADTRHRGHAFAAL